MQKGASHRSGSIHSGSIHWGKPAWAVAGVMLLAACDPSQVADQAGRRIASTVVLPVVQIDLPTPLAQAATSCIVQNATAEEVQALARDVAVVAGSSTKATIRGIALRPEAAACFAQNGVPQVRP